MEKRKGYGNKRKKKEDTSGKENLKFRTYIT